MRFLRDLKRKAKLKAVKIKEGFREKLKVNQLNRERKRAGITGTSRRSRVRLRKYQEGIKRKGKKSISDFHYPPVNDNTKFFYRPPSIWGYWKYINVKVKTKTGRVITQIIKVTDEKDFKNIFGKRVKVA